MGFVPRSSAAFDVPSNGALTWAALDEEIDGVKKVLKANGVSVKALRAEVEAHRLKVQALLVRQSMNAEVPADFLKKIRAFIQFHTMSILEPVPALRVLPESVIDDRVMHPKHPFGDQHPHDEVVTEAI